MILKLNLTIKFALWIFVFLSLIYIYILFIDFSKFQKYGLFIVIRIFLIMLKLYILSQIIWNCILWVLCRSSFSCCWQDNHLHSHTFSNNLAYLFNGCNLLNAEKIGTRHMTSEICYGNWKVLNFKFHHIFSSKY